MDQRVYHGRVTPSDLASALLAEFNRGNLNAQILGSGNKMAVQIATRRGSMSGGQTALTITIQKHTDGVLVSIGQQAWLGIAASLGQTAFSVMRNPFNLLGRLDDLAQDIENLQLTEKVWQVIGTTMQALAASHQISERLARITCEYCETANTIGEPNCIACGAPLGDAQPRTCNNCGYVVSAKDQQCPNCRQRL